MFALINRFRSTRPTIGTAAMAVALLSLVGCGNDKNSADTTVAVSAETAAAVAETSAVVAAASATDTTAPFAAPGAPAATGDASVPATITAAPVNGRAPTVVTTSALPPGGPGCPRADGSSERMTHWDSAPPMCIDVSKTFTATVATSEGPFTITFDPGRAPLAVNSFVFLARWHYFDGSAFHRVVPNFVIQGGSLNGDGRSGPGYSFADELPRRGDYKVGSVAMAHPPSPDTNDSQFFVITGAEGVALPPEYSLFGQVTAGMEAVNAIAALGNGDGPPSKPVSIDKVTIEEK